MGLNLFLSSKLSMFILGLFFYLIVLCTLIYPRERKAQEQNRHFWIASHSAGPVVAAFATGASDMSSWLFMGLPGAVYLWGAQDIYLCIGLIIGAYISWTYWSPMVLTLFERHEKAQSFVHVLTEELCSSCPQNKLRVALALMIIFFTVIYIAAGLLAMGKLLHYALALEKVYADLLGALILAFCALIAGARGLNRLELFQGALVLVFLLILTSQSIQMMATHQNLTEDLLLSNSHSSLNPLRLIHDLSWGLGYLGMPHILNRMAVLKDKKDIPKARNILLIWMFLALGSAFTLGWIAQSTLKGLSDHEMIIPTLLGSWPHFFSGFALASLIGSCLCAGCAQIFASSSSLASDCGFKDVTPKQAIFSIVFFAVMLAYFSQHDVFSLVDLGWAGLTTTFTPYLMLIKLGRKISAQNLLRYCLFNFFLINLAFFFNLFGQIGVLLPCLMLHFFLLFISSSPNPQSVTFFIKKF